MFWLAIAIPAGLRSQTPINQTASKPSLAIASHSPSGTERRSIDAPLFTLSSPSQTQVLISYRTGYRGHAGMAITSAVFLSKTTATEAVDLRTMDTEGAAPREPSGSKLTLTAHGYYSQTIHPMLSRSPGGIRSRWIFPTLADAGPHRGWHQQPRLDDRDPRRHGNPDGHLSLLRRRVHDPASGSCRK